MEAYVLSVRPAESMEASCHLHSDITPVPRLDIVLIYFGSLLVALSISIEVCMCLEPSDVFAIGRIGEELSFRRCVKKVNRESKLVLAISRRGTE